MKTLKKFILLLLLTGLFTSGSCSDDDEFRPTLPPITQTGENTFGCYVDGQLLTPRDGTGTLHTQDKGVSYSGSGTGPNYDYNEIKIRDFKTGNMGLFDLHIVDLHETGVGTYTINESNCEDGGDANPNINIRIRWFDEKTQTLKWYCSIENGGILIITRYDFENRIVSGTFNCTLQNRDDASDIIEIAEGRFDLKWDTVMYTNFP
ncbi:hypothetical protein UMM65_00375 [Aureibaculum sp. 2210JD6-5]|uniref:hypothetical protein n=1 Tax=Aureibaculum sp. 2210JD6-5 TaxID=3103957 RepID=UPI002AAC5C69|nr:hypothetical protein [Aureibaculum sp. 2210JD6-5]MDY7393684.1 hypothetical protein [Aureibaculum sp. 2210JD6-5]